MAKVGRPKQEIKKEHIICFRLTEDDYHRLKAYAAFNDCSVTQVLQKSISDLLKEEVIGDLQSVNERGNENGVKKRSERKSSSKGGVL